ncbi:MAG: hypothetical protein OXI70_07195, partial [Chloroflexota bacterium]|nr:hypothetical protein [Chloroflexota bacterium]
MKMRRSTLVLAALALVMGLQLAGPVTEPAEAQSSTRPTMSDAEVNGSKLTITFDQALDPAAAPWG